jgi:hypothetical protein
MTAVNALITEPARLDIAGRDHLFVGDYEIPIGFGSPGGFNEGAMECIHTPPNLRMGMDSSVSGAMQ